MSKIIFFGTPNYVLPVLEELEHDRHEIVAVVTQPPKPVGRKQELTESPVSAWAKAKGVPVFDKPPKDLGQDLKGIDAEVGVVAAYGRIIPAELLTIYPYGLVNIHPSLLPLYRGPSPIEAAIASGDEETGVTIMIVDEEMDHGPIISQEVESIQSTDTKESLRERLFAIGAKHLVEVLPGYITGKVTPKEQEHEKAVYTTLLKKEHGLIPSTYLSAALEGESLDEDWELGFIRSQAPLIKEYKQKPTPSSVERFIRALDPWPGAWTQITIDGQQKRLKLLKGRLEANKLILDLVQLEGKTPVSWEQFRKGYPEASFTP